MKDRTEEIFLSDLDPNLKISCLIRKSKRARRINLRIRSKEQVILTLPSWTSYQEGFSFLAKQKKWLEQKVENLPTIPNLSQYFLAGGQVWLNENPVCLSWVIDTDRKQLLTESLEDRIHLHLPDTGNVEKCLFNFLRELAREDLKLRLGVLSREAGLKWKKIRIGNQSTRWGSCSAKKTISLNWRLILLPYRVANYVIYHELAHLKHLNHSAKFWDYLEKLCPNSRVYDRRLLKEGRTGVRLGHQD